MINYILKHKIKQYIFPILFIICILYSPSFAHASDSSSPDINNQVTFINSIEEPKPYTVYIMELRVAATSEYNDATCTISLTPVVTVTNCDLKIQLQQKTSSGYTTIATWNETTSKPTYVKRFSYVPSTHGTYRFRVSVTTYDSSGNTEYTVADSFDIVY